MIQKQGNWVPYELKPRNVECRLFICEMLLARHKRKSFLHRIVIGDEKWIHYDNPKKRKSWGSASTAKPNIYGKTLMLYLVGSAWCCVLWVAQPERDHYWGSLPNTIDEIEPSTQGKTRPLLLHKIILLHGNARPHVAAPVKTYLETLKWEVLSHPPYSSDIDPFDYHLFRSLTHSLSEQHFTSYEDTKTYIDDWIASKDEASDVVSICYQKDGKK